MQLVPKDALVLNGNDRSVFVVDLDSGNAAANALAKDAQATGTVRKVNVDLGVAVGNRIQVLGSVAAGDLVVVVGNERLIPNTSVKIIREVATDNK